MNYYVASGAGNWTTFTSEKLTNGQMGELLGLKVIVSNSVTASGAAIIATKDCGNYLELQPMQTVTVPDPGIKYTIRSWEIGQVQVTNPKAVYFIDGV
jgi:hypothetical protein